MVLLKWEMGGRQGRDAAVLVNSAEMEPHLHNGRQQEIIADRKVEADYNEAFKVTNCQISLRVFSFYGKWSKWLIDEEGEVQLLLIKCWPL